jgi:hypothetical protein
MKGQKKKAIVASNEPATEAPEHDEQGEGHTDQDTDAEQGKSIANSKKADAGKKKQLSPSRTSPRKGAMKTKTGVSAPQAAAEESAPSHSPSESQALEKRSLSMTKKRQTLPTSNGSGPFSTSEPASPSGEHETGLSRKGSSGNLSSGHQQPHPSLAAPPEGAHHHHGATSTRHSIHQEHSWSHLRHHVVHNPRRRGSKHRHHGGPDGDHHCVPAPRDALPSVDKEKCMTAYHTHHDLLSSPWGVHQLLSECGLSVSPPLLEHFLREVGLSPDPKDDDRFFLTAEKFLDIVALLRTNLPVIQSSYFDSDEQLLELACFGLGGDEQRRTNLAALIDTFKSFSLSTEPLKVFEVRKQAKVLQGKSGTVVEDPSQTSVPFETLSKLLNIEVSEKNLLAAQSTAPAAAASGTGNHNQRGMSIFQAASRKGSLVPTPKAGSLTPGAAGTSIIAPPGRSGSVFKSAQQRQSFAAELDRHSSLRGMKSNSKCEADDREQFGVTSQNANSAGPSLSPFEFPITPPTQGLTPAQTFLQPQQGSTSHTSSNNQSASSVLPPKAAINSPGGRQEKLIAGGTAAATSGAHAKRRVTLPPATLEDPHLQSIRSHHQPDSNNQSTRSFQGEMSGLGLLSESLQTSLAPSPVRRSPRGSIRGASPVDERNSSLDSNDGSFGFGGQPRGRVVGAQSKGEGEERRLTLSEQVSIILKRKRDARENRNRPWTVDPHLSPIHRSDDMERLKPYRSQSNRIPEEIFLQKSSKIKIEVLDSVDQGRLRQRLSTPPVHRGTDYPSPKRLPLIESSGCFRSPNPHGMERLPTQVQRWVRSSLV